MCPLFLVFKDMTFKVHRLSNNKKIVLLLSLLIENGHLTKSSVFLCTACADSVSQKINDTVPSQEHELVKQVVKH